jgi:hypothetical protein
MVYKTETISSIQERECSMAFFAGMLDCLVTMLQVADSTEDIEKSARLVEGLRVDIACACKYANQPTSPPEQEQ